MSQNSQLKIIKIGGNIIDNPGALESFLEKFSATMGKKILVHGGGRMATQLANQMGIKTQMIEGRRVTDKEMLDVVTMVYAGLINKNIVAALQKNKCDAIGLSGADINSIQTVKRPVKEIDYGYVGDVLHDSVNVLSIKKLLEAGFVPVFSAITHNGNGVLLNTNADTIASALAIALADRYEVSLVYCFEKKGVLRDVNDEKSLIKHICMDEYEELKNENVITHGMIPKIDNAFAAIEKGVDSVYIGHALNLHLFQNGSFGTKLTR